MQNETPYVRNYKAIVIGLYHELQTAVTILGTTSIDGSTRMR